MAPFFDLPFTFSSEIVLNEEEFRTTLCELQDSWASKGCWNDDSRHLEHRLIDILESQVKIWRESPVHLPTSRLLSLIPSNPVLLTTKLLDNIDRAMDPNVWEKKEFDKFNAELPVLSNFLTETPELRDIPETNRWVSRVLQYNVPHGKRNRGFAIALAYRDLAGQPDVDIPYVKLSYILGWSVELFLQFGLDGDDIMDKAETTKEQVDLMGATATNDSILLDGVIYKILKEYFHDCRCYTDLVEIMREAQTIYKSAYGQNREMRAGLLEQMETYTMDRYNGIVKYKTGYYSFYLPVALAMAMARVTHSELKLEVKKITLEIGNFFQVQDDYLDCFGDSAVTGRIGTDIQDCKCSWLFVTALEKATPIQREILMANYGQDEEPKIATVKNVYIEMGIPDLYHKYEETTYNSITTHIQEMSPSLPRRFFNRMLAKIYRRSN